MQEAERKANSGENPDEVSSDDDYAQELRDMTDEDFESFKLPGE